MDPKLDQNGEPIPWDPSQIPSTKPFVNIATTAHESLSTIGNMKFVKTNSSVYSTFHKNTRKINFEIGYSNDATWFDSLSEKWLDYVYFFVGGFYEATYSINEKDPNTMITKIDAKIIDYDARFRQTNTQTSKSPTSLNPSTNAFAQRRSASSTPQTPRQTFSSQIQSHVITPTISKRNTTIPQQSSDIGSVIIDDTENDDQYEALRTDSVVMEDAENDDQHEVLRTDSVVMEDTSDHQLTAKPKDLNQLPKNDPEFDEFYDFYQKFKTQKLQQSKIYQTDAFRPIATTSQYNSISGLAVSEWDATQSKK
jgi:hypothetical protein